MSTDFQFKLEITNVVAAHFVTQARFVTKVTERVRFDALPSRFVTPARFVTKVTKVTKRQI